MLALILLLACDRNYTPKPAGYLRVHYPDKEYTLFNGDAPFSFLYPVYAEVKEDRSGLSENYWYNIFFPGYDGTIHLSYKKVEGNLDGLVEDCRTLVYKHTTRSDGIDELPFIDTVNQRYGILYDLKGNVASSVQFFVTDSIEHFLRGSLYFNTTPNRDSLRPVIDFIRDDIEYLIESIEWK